MIKPETRRLYGGNYESGTEMYNLSLTTEGIHVYVNVGNEQEMTTNFLLHLL